MESILFLFLLSVSCLSSKLVVSAISFGNDTDRLALLAFKNQITGDPTGVLNSWNDSTSYCEWVGVLCSRKHPDRVRGLDLPSRGLVGSLSPAIGNLTFLRGVRLPSNKFFGSVPPEIGRLQRLQYLNLSYNIFQGNIPVNLSHCRNLRVLDLNDNQLQGRIPIELSSLPKFETLGLEANNITGVIPPWLGNLSSLDTISIRANLLEGSIPGELGKLANLGFLQVSENKLSGKIPPSIFNISTLYLLNVAINYRLHGSLPGYIGIGLPNLKYLFLASNQFEGSIPTSVSNLSKLEIFNAPYNSFSGLIPSSLGAAQPKLYQLELAHNNLEARDPNGWEFLNSLTNASSLQLLGLNSNLFAGTLPRSVANLSRQLQYLAIGANQISGTIPSGIENLVNLYGLEMDGNFFSGNIPDGVGKLKMLEYLYLFNNNLTGHIPSSLGNLTQLSRLVLLGNRLEGAIPRSLGNLPRLEVLDLSSNSLIGTIPKEVVGISSLTDYMDLSLNSLIGSLPPEVGSLNNLNSLNVSGNKLSGEIPDTLGNCAVLQDIVMHNNFFQGAIPPSLSSIRGLRNLDLSNNNLSGMIPESLESLHYLENLNLSFNGLDGAVPTKGVFGNEYAVSIRGNKRLCGGIPELHLPECPPNETSASRKRRLSRLLRVLIPAASTIFCLVVIVIAVFLYWKLKLRKKAPSESTLDDQYPKVSYIQLVKATDGFSSANLLGTGRYGSVYKGSLDHGNTTVAVKVLNLEQLGASRSFMAECNALRQIRHRNLIKIITSCSSLDSKQRDFKALVYEFMPNGSLEAWLHSESGDHRPTSSLNPIQRLNIAIDVADALSYLHHDCGTTVVHCDLKPGNVLLDENMTAHVGDFGLAKIIFESPSMSLQDSASSVGIRGSIGYVAPEYGTGRQATTSGDVYSYGILLLEMFTGKRPVDDSFKDGLTLHGFVEMSFPWRLLETSDPSLLVPSDDSINESYSTRRIQECLISVLRIGLLCSKVSPGERMNMRDVAHELHSIRNVFNRV